LHTLETALEGILALCGTWLMIMLVYQLVLTIFGFRRETKDYQDYEPQSRFLILVPAHNEEKVIGDIVRNLQEMDYPKELYDFYIIADNCTDNTAQAARNAGAQVIVHNKEKADDPTGKPIALKYAMDQLGDFYRRYDLMMIFDADNLMDKCMLREVNSQYLDKDRPDLIQCYLGCKNKKGVVAWFYYTSYTATNRFFQLAKHRLGVNCSVGGTGYAITTAYLKERGGWTCNSLTEDIEIQVEATLAGKRILWNHNARLYDEKPTSIVASIRQKIRWAQGHWYVALRNTRPLWQSLRQKKIGLHEFISLFLYMYSLTTYLAALISLVCSLLLLLTGEHKLVADANLWSSLWGVVIFVYSYFGLFYLADRVDNGERFDWKTLPMMVWSFAANMVVGAISQLVGLWRHRQQHTWVKTEHKLHGEGTTPAGM